MSRDVELGGDAAADARALRDAFGCFTTGVTVVTTCTSEGAPAGFTANSFASVSLDPPLVLVCVDLKANSLPALDASGVFVVNVLHAGQRDTARRFAQRDADKFDATAYETWETGAPVLSGSMANFECRTEQSFDAGDHRVVIGRVLKVRMDPDHQPLVFWKGSYCGVRV